MTNVTILVTKQRKETNKPSYSPGLEMDAQVYIDKLKQIKNIVISIIPDYITDNEKHILNTLNKSNIVFGFETIGDDKMINFMKHMKVKPIIILIPNLEVMSYSYKWKSTIDNINLVDYIICKDKSIKPLITKQFPKIKSLIIRHILPSIPYTIPLIPAKRRNILHFAGSSPYKNSVENIKAGIKIIELYPKDFDKIVICISSWKNNVFALGNAIKTITNLADEHKIIDLHIGGYISDNKKYEILSTTKLALCCSNCEGFGHTIQEASAFGCLVITTDGIPMKNSLKHGVAFAKPSLEKKFNYGIYYTIDSDAIVDAYSELSSIDYDLKTMQLCMSNNVERNKNFDKDFKKLDKVLKVE